MLAFKNYINKKVSKGETVGYCDGAWRAEQDTYIAAPGIGYGDGFPYFSWPYNVNINGNTYETVGKINMDLITIIIGNEHEINVGDWGNCGDMRQTYLNFPKAFIQFHTSY